MGPAQRDPSPRAWGSDAPEGTSPREQSRGRPQVSRWPGSEQRPGEAPRLGHGAPAGPPSPGHTVACARAAHLLGQAGPGAPRAPAGGDLRDTRRPAQVGGGRLGLPHLSSGGGGAGVPAPQGQAAFQWLSLSWSHRFRVGTQAPRSGPGWRGWMRAGRDVLGAGVEESCLEGLRTSTSLAGRRSGP